MQTSISQNGQHQTLHTSKLTIPVNNIKSSSSSSVSAGIQTSNNTSSGVQSTAINTEEFAKLDALLEDLLAEVEQPILLNKYNENIASQEENFSVNQQNSHIKMQNSSDEVERSVDWLNEQKQILRSRKDALKHSAVKVSDTNLSYAKHVDQENSFKEQIKYAQQCDNDNNAHTYSGNEESSVPTLNGALNGYLTHTRRTPLTTDRQLYSPSQQQSSQQQGQSFRSLSTNPTLLRNINEIDDEINMIDSEFDRYSQRSLRSSQAGTVQRSKYHTVSNDFVECTRPPAPTPVPSSSYHTNRGNNPGKRALSAPPVELGKVMLQRMELKSPVTVRQGSCIPFEQPKMIQYPYEQQQRTQTPLKTPMSNRYIDNNLGMYNTGREPQSQSIVQYQPQAQIRNAFLNTDNTNRVGYTNGYETDSGIPNGYGTYRGPSGYVQQQTHVYNGDNGMYAPRKANIINGYRTIGGPVSRGYNNEQGYETDTGLIKLRQALDNRRALSRNDLPIQHQQQMVPNGYYYHGGSGRSITPSFNTFNYNMQMQQQRETPRDQYNSQQQYRSNNNPQYSSHTTVQDPNQFLINAYTNDVNDEMLNNSQFIDPNEQFQQFLDTNVTYLDEDEQLRQQHYNANATMERQQQQFIGNQQPSSQSVIIQQQRAPSAYSMRDAPSRQGYTSSATNVSIQQPYLNGQLSTSQQITKQDMRPEVSRRSSANSLMSDGNEVLRNHPKYVKTTQNFWYKPKISRDEAINLLKDKAPGTFLIRDSNNFPGAYGLALKVDKPPANVQIKPGSDPLNELVRHFLIEPTTKGVRIKGCYNEPIFGSLAALVYQHSLTPLALPCKLNLPAQDLMQVNQISSKQANNDQRIEKPAVKQSSQQASTQDARHLLEKGAACHVYYLCTTNVENKNGLEAITYALSTNRYYQAKDSSSLIVIQFKVTSQGVTLTDLNKKKFLRQHFPTTTVSYCAIEERMNWPNKLEKISKPRIFGLVTKPSANLGNNECHLFVELDPDQPAIAIVDFINRYLIPSKVKK